MYVYSLSRPIVSLIQVRWCCMNVGKCLLNIYLFLYFSTRDKVLVVFSINLQEENNHLLVIHFFKQYVYCTSIKMPERFFFIKGISINSQITTYLRSYLSSTLYLLFYSYLMSLLNTQYPTLKISGFGFISHNIIILEQTKLPCTHEPATI